MMKQYTRVCARIDLDAIEYNIEKMKEKLDSQTKIMAVMKMDGYGHGAVPIARMLSGKDYIWGFAVATLEEGVSLRHGGVIKPILALGAVFPEQRKAMLENDIRMTCYTEKMAEEISKQAAELGKKAYLHIKLDTGMSRLGFPVNEESAASIEKIAKLPGIEMEGLFTHFAKADEADKDFTEKQFESYLWMKNRLAERGVDFQYYHCSNSAGILDMRHMDLDLVRAGIAVYGLYPSDETNRQEIPLKPALELVSHVAHVKWVEAGTPVSYGSTHITRRPTKIVTVPVGYGDGYPRSLSDKGYVLIHGQKAPVLGRICMDQFMADATEIEHVEYGDKVILVGRSGSETISVERLSQLSGRFHYEFVCALGKRIPREYLRHGEVESQTDFFE